MKHLLLISIAFISTLYSHHIGLCIVATGKYLSYAEQLIRSARTHFFSEDGYTVTYFVFTDGQLQKPAHDIVVIPQKRLGWPYDTLMRCKMYDSAQALFATCDYLFACDADMLFVDQVGSEILAESVATQHPGYLGKRGTYETNKHSTAYVRPHEGKCYFAGGFYGGRREQFIIINHVMSRRIKKDLKNNIVAVWHDESHLNRYWIDFPPTKTLSPSYCYPESWHLPFHKRLLALDKNHAEMRI